MEIFTGILQLKGVKWVWGWSKRRRVVLSTIAALLVFNYLAAYPAFSCIRGVCCIATTRGLALCYWETNCRSKLYGSNSTGCRRGSASACCDLDFWPFDL